MKTFLLSCASLLMTLCAFAQLNVTQIRVEHLENPIGIDQQNPLLSWIIESAERNSLQSAYEIQVSSSPKLKGDVWKSGKMIGETSVNVKYQGAALKAAQKYYWRVRVWDNHGKISSWSSTGSWQMGLLDSANWKAQWIEAENIPEKPSYIRKAFQINKKIASATAFISARGLYTAYINGQRVGDDYLTPGWTSYKHRIQYQAYDVSSLLKNGSNAIGTILGHGWYAGRLTWSRDKTVFSEKTAFLMQVLINYTDGTQEYVLSDASWKYSSGEISFSGIYDGETVDHRKAQAGWNTAKFNDKDWTAVKSLDYSFSNLVATQNEPVKKYESLKPIQVITTPKGEKVIDFGQNAVGWEIVKLKGNAGDTVRIFHAEVLDQQGNFYTENLRSAKATSTYILKSGDEEIFEPSFTFYGGRYLKVEGIRGNLNPENFQFVVVHSAMPKNGSFSSSNALVNKLQENIQWGQRGNFLDVPTDCPQRDERLGWTGDAQAFFRTASFNYDVQAFFTKWMQDLALDQNQDGSVSNVIPDVLTNAKRFSGGAFGWGDAATIIPWQMYRAYGDLQFLEKQYPSMKAWVSYLEKNTKANIRNIDRNRQYGDWLFYSLDNDNGGNSAITDKNMIAQCFYAHSTQLLLDAAEALGYLQDAAYYKGLLKNIKEAYVAEYMTPNGQLVSNTQTAYVLALHFDMLPEAKREQAAKRLADNIKLYKNHLTTGFLGTPYLCHVLSRFGHADLAYQLLLQETYPSWLYPVKKGATTIWERWNGIKPDGSFQYASMNSFNHYAYGAIGDWLYRTGAGLSEDAPGFKKLIVKPLLGGKFTQMQAEQNTPYGKASSAWEIKDKTLTMQVQIPVNTTATVYIPTNKSESITESGKALSEHPEITVHGIEKEYKKTFTRLTLGSGSYSFSCTLP